MQVTVRRHPTVTTGPPGDARGPTVPPATATGSLSGTVAVTVLA